MIKDQGLLHYYFFLSSSQPSFHLAVHFETNGLQIRKRHRCYAQLSAGSPTGSSGPSRETSACSRGTNSLNCLRSVTALAQRSNGGGKALSEGASAPSGRTVPARHPHPLLTAAAPRLPRHLSPLSGPRGRHPKWPPLSRVSGPGCRAPPSSPAAPAALPRLCRGAGAASSVRGRRPGKILLLQPWH